jgi:two-component system LytT family sensor kinase
LAGCIVVSARRDGRMLVLEVRDDGPGMACGEGASKDGVGISSTRARLEKLYGSAQRFELRNAERGGVVATLAFPFRVSASSPSSEEGEVR